MMITKKCHEEQKNIYKWQKNTQISHKENTLSLKDKSVTSLQSQ